MKKTGQQRTRDQARRRVSRRAAAWTTRPAGLPADPHVAPMSPHERMTLFDALAAERRREAHRRSVAIINQHRPGGQR